MAKYLKEAWRWGGEEHGDGVGSPQWTLASLGSFQLQSATCSVAATGMPFPDIATFSNTENVILLLSNRSD
jgi:hypothetical protein